MNAQGQKALGMGGAFTAYNRDASSAFFNPGAMVMLDSGRYLSAGTTLLMPKTVFRNTTTGQLSEQDDQSIFPSYFYAVLPVSNRLSAGLSVNTPFGWSTRWTDDWEGRAINQETRLRTIYVQPTVSYRLTDNFSAGAGLVYGNGNLLVRRQLGEFNGNVKLNGSASGFGFNAGVFGKIQEELSFGITYRSALNFKINNGEATFSNIPAFHAGQFRDQGFKTRLKMPSVLSVGLTNRVTNKVILSFEFNLTGWSSYDSLNFDFEHETTPDTKAGRRYEDAMAFRVGGEYTHSDKLTFRAGAYFDETPIRDEFISPDLPDGTRLGFTGGLSYKLTDRLEADGTFLFEHVSERRAKANITQTNISNIGGTYRTLVTGAGIGLNYKF